MNWNIIGHNQIVSFLENGIVNNSLSHAYLFCGPKSIGKKTLIKQFILTLLCYNQDPHKEQIPCLACDACRQTQNKTNPDVIWISKEVDKKNITVEQIRELEDKLSIHSFFNSYKIAVIENAENMSLAACNALLKTLEEPTKKTILILTAQKVDNLPATVLSRVQKIKFLPVDKKDIIDYLVSKNQSREYAHELASLSAGRPGRALIFLHNPEFWSVYQQQIKNFFTLLRSSRVTKMQFIDKFLVGKETLVEKNAKIIPLLNLWQIIFRDIFLHKLNQNDRIINIVSQSAINTLAPIYSFQKIILSQNNIEKTKNHLVLNVNPKLALENLLLNF